MPISRRAFLGGAAGTAVAGGGAWAALLRDSLEAAAPTGRPSPATTLAPVTTTTTTVAEAVASSSARLPVTDRVLVVLEMDGGNDALNTLVPALFIRVFMRIVYSVLVNRSRCVGAVGDEAAERVEVAALRVERQRERVGQRVRLRDDERLLARGLGLDAETGEDGELLDAIRRVGRQAREDVAARVLRLRQRRHELRRWLAAVTEDRYLSLSPEVCAFLECEAAAHLTARATDRPEPCAVN